MIKIMTYYRLRQKSYCNHWMSILMLMGGVSVITILMLPNNTLCSSIKVGNHNRMPYKINNMIQRNVISKCEKTDKLKYLEKEKEKDCMLERIDNIDKTISSLQNTKKMYHLNKNETRTKLKDIIHYHTGIPMYNINLDKFEDILKLSQWINLEDARNILIDVQDVFLIDIYKYKMIHVELLLELLYDIDHTMEMRQKCINERLKNKINS